MDSKKILTGGVWPILMGAYAHEAAQLTMPTFNTPPAFPTPGSNRKAAKRRSGIQYRHGKAGRK